LFCSTIDQSVNEGGHIDSMVQRVHYIVFIDSVVVQDVINVESGMTNIAPSKEAKKRKWLYRTMNQQRETTQYIVGKMIEVRPYSTLLEVLNVLYNFSVKTE